jgi:sulfatase modifying factor 1
MKLGNVVVLLTAVLLSAAGAAVAGENPVMARLPAGDFLPFFKFNPAQGQIAEQVRPIQLRAFRLESAPVANAQFLAFLRAHPEWRRSKAKSLFVGSRYLAKWRGDFAPPQGEDQAPVTNVSWFAASAYCEARGLRLPTSDEWEYALADAGRGRQEVTQKSLEWFSAPNAKKLAAVRHGAPNGYGIYDMVGLVWEWTQDFSSAATGTEQRNTSSKDEAQFCGGGASGVRDAADYPGFMRYALRASLKAAYTQDNLGFRCAGDE